MNEWKVLFRYIPRTDFSVSLRDWKNGAYVPTLSNSHKSLKKYKNLYIVELYQLSFKLLTIENIPVKTKLRALSTQVRIQIS